MSTDLQGLATAVLRRAPGRTLTLADLRSALAAEGAELGTGELRRMLDAHPRRFHLTDPPDPFSAAWGWSAPQREAYVAALRETGAADPVRVMLVDGGDAPAVETGTLTATEAVDASIARLWASASRNGGRHAELTAALLEARALRAALAELPGDGQSCVTAGEEAAPPLPFRIRVSER